MEDEGQEEANGTNEGHLVHDEEAGVELSHQESQDSKTLRHRHTSNFDSAAVQFKDINVEVGSSKRRKKILQDVDGTVTSGHVLAIMGPSGAGKTTLISALTLDAFGTTPTGTIILNGKTITSDLFKRFCFVVKQQDRHWYYLTCRETMIYAAELYDIAFKSNIPVVVDEIITKMGLDVCKNVKCGRLSGGQKRRLSIAIALLKQPAVIFLDEPTSGLDAASASHIMKEIKRIAKVEKLIIICTIHQPSTKVYDGFDNVMILSKGREAFHGKQEDAEGYFESIGHPMPRATNPAEFFLDLVNADFSTDDEVDSILDAWEAHKKDNNDITRNEDSYDPINGASESRSVVKEISVLLRRHAILILRDPILYAGRAIIFLLANLFFALVYLKARPYTQDQALNKMVLNVLNNEWKAVNVEVKNGMLRPLSYVFVKSLLVLPIMIIFGLFAIGPSGYGVMAFEPSSFVAATGLWVCLIYVYECLSEALSVLIDDPILGMLNFMNIWFASFLFGGFLIPLSDMFWPFKIFYYVLPFSNVIRSMVYAEFIDATWEPCNPLESTDSAVCVDSTDGAAVLDAVGKVYPLISSENKIASDVGIMLLIALFFKFVYVACVLIRSRKVASVTDTSASKHGEMLMPTKTIDVEQKKATPVRELDNEGEA
eukprot:scaffold31452_cov48-Attheya_sp.AAC.2